MQLMPVPGFQGDLALYQGHPLRQGPPLLPSRGKVPCPPALRLCTPAERRVSSGLVGLVSAGRADMSPGTRSSMFWALHFFITIFPPDKPNVMSAHMVWAVCVCDRFS